MPREIRKRGKKKSKAQDHEEFAPPAPAPAPEFQPVQAAVNEGDGPSWMRNAPSFAGPSTNPLADIEAPFGYVDADVKAYFRTVDMKLREWQAGTGEDDDLPEGVDANAGAFAVHIIDFLLVLNVRWECREEGVRDSRADGDGGQRTAVGHRSRLLDYP